MSIYYASYGKESKGHKAIELLQEKGALPNSITISDFDRRVDNFQHHSQVAESGVYLDYNIGSG